MTKRSNLFLIASLAIALARCTPAPAPVVARVPQGNERFIIDPRTGYETHPTPANATRFDDAWRAIVAGDYTTARKRLDDIRAREPGYTPAQLAEAAILLREGKPDAARPIADRALSKRPHYVAAEVYAAEIAIAEKRTRQAYDQYRDIASRAGAPATAAERVAELGTMLFDQLYNAATAAPDDEAIRLLREALVINPSASSARILLSQKLLGQHKYDEAKTELAPILSTGDVDRTEVQEVLAEVDISHKRYEAAIARYERLSKRDRRFAARLDEIKGQYAEANMPPQLQRAIESEAITRGDLAVVIYWKVASVRFASNMAAPPIAIDIGETPGRDEIVRAMALGIYPVDPITRRVSPYSPVSTGALTRITARLLALRGAACARGVGSDPQKVLSSCAVVDPTLGAGTDAPVSGRVAAGVMEQVDRALSTR
ncbi:MAG TPA: tetratricopeptide repeat protein [Thermoanaerobaculia bacterium]|nr:tetratricopeptide repeat protein [Thermoanaerobaculia bacterium]